MTTMAQLTIEIPDAPARRLAWLASEQKKKRRASGCGTTRVFTGAAAENLEEKYARFFQQSGLFVERLAEEQPRYQAVSEARLQELAAKLGAAGPLSEVIVAERGRN